jgi:hypothetical protein
MWELLYIIISVTIAYIGIQSSSFLWWGICVLILVCLLMFTANRGGFREFYEDVNVTSEKSSLWASIIELPKNALETVKPSLNHVIDSVSGKNTPDQPQPDSDGTVPPEPTAKDKIQKLLGKDASSNTVDDMANLCYYLHTMKGSDPLAYKRLLKTYLKR